jgi:hypothetical protein
MSAFGQVIEQAFATVDAVAGDDLFYCRGNVELPISAVPGTSTFSSADANGYPVTFRSQDFMFNASLLVFGGVAAAPKVGDRVKWSTGGKTRTFEVLRDVDQFYRYCDRARTRIRIHTKEVK